MDAAELQLLTINSCSQIHTTVRKQENESAVKVMLKNQESFYEA